jgi:NAD(P)-dependent dehydrogenase (short-subunit alcohol dehydrogenase family)
MDHQHYQAPKDLLAGKTIAITGAGDGIGKTAALTFAAHGATVILMGRTVQKLEQVYDAIEASGAPTPAIYPIDFNGANEDDYRDMHDNLAKTFPHLDGLLFNAGELGQRTPLANYKLESWQKVMQVNVNSQFMMVKALLPLLELAPSASVVFTSSSVGRNGRPFWGAYAVSKFATEGLCQVLAGELEGTGNVRVNCINPGATRTQMRASAYPAEDPNTLKTAEDIMPAYLYLMGSDSAAVTGQSLDAQ